MNALPATGPADLRDQRWLDERIADIESGVEAVLEIASNWMDGRQVGRLHPGLSPAEYVKEHVGALRLGKAEVAVLLAETNWSNRQIAAVAGVDERTVRRAANAAPDRGPVLGGDGKTYSPRVVEAVVIETPLDIQQADDLVRWARLMSGSARLLNEGDPDWWAGRLPSEDRQSLRSHIAVMRRWCEGWERALDRDQRLRVVEEPDGPIA